MASTLGLLSNLQNYQRIESQQISPTQKTKRDTKNLKPQYNSTQGYNSQLATPNQKNSQKNPSTLMGKAVQIKKTQQNNQNFSRNRIQPTNNTQSQESDIITFTTQLVKQQSEVSSAKNLSHFNYQPKFFRCSSPEHKVESVKGSNTEKQDPERTSNRSHMSYRT